MNILGQGTSARAKEGSTGVEFLNIMRGGYIVESVRAHAHLLGRLLDTVREEGALPLVAVGDSGQALAHNPLAVVDLGQVVVHVELVDGLALRANIKPPWIVQNPAALRLYQETRRRIDT